MVFRSHPEGRGARLSGAGALGTHLAKAGALSRQTPPQPRPSPEGGHGLPVARTGDALAAQQGGSRLGPAPRPREESRRLAGGLPGGGPAEGARRPLRGAGVARSHVSLSPLLALALPSLQTPPHPARSAALILKFQISGTGARVFLQRVYQQREAAAAVSDAEPDGPTSENLVSEQKDERKKLSRDRLQYFREILCCNRRLGPLRGGGKGEIILFYFYFYFLTRLFSAGGNWTVARGWPPLPFPARLSGQPPSPWSDSMWDRDRAWNGGEGKVSDPRRVDTVGARGQDSFYLKENTPRDHVLLLGLGGGRGESRGRSN